jgi:hypothetical protein
MINIARLRTNAATETQQPPPDTTALPAIPMLTLKAICEAGEAVNAEKIIQEKITRYRERFANFVVVSSGENCRSLASRTGARACCATTAEGGGGRELRDRMRAGVESWVKNKHQRQRGYSLCWESRRPKTASVNFTAYIVPSSGV